MRRSFTVLAVLAVCAAAHADPVEPLRFGLVVHVGAEARGEPVLGPDAVAAWVSDASELFGQANLAFEVERTHLLEPGTDELHTIRARHALARHLVDRRINVFVVSVIHDPNPSRTTQRAAAMQGRGTSGRLGGAHIRTSRHVPATYAIVKAGSSPSTLAHELGHFFGAGHHPDPENIMSYGHARHRFDEAQLRAFRHFARRYVRRGELRPLRAPSGVSARPAALR